MLSQSYWDSVSRGQKWMDEQIAQKRHAIHSSGAGRVDVHPFPENPPDGLHGSVVKLLHGKEITPVPIRWLWDGWLAAGKTHILGGAPGVGKSTLALSLAFPMLGLTQLAIMALDLVILSALPPLKRLVS